MKPDRAHQQPPFNAPGLERPIVSVEGRGVGMDRKAFVP